MYSDSDVDAYVGRLRSVDSEERALAADEATDGVSDWGQHSYTASQAERMTRALVDALASENNNVAREAMVNALATLVAWNLAPRDEVLRAIALPRTARDPAHDHWAEIEEWARRQADPMLAHLVDLEADYNVDVDRVYDPRELIRYAFGASDYWAGLALAWLSRGAPNDGLENDLLDLEEQEARPQSLRHHARRLRKTLY